MTSVLSLPSSFDRIVSTIKAKADMDIAEQRLPQDGGISTSILNSDYDLRVSTIVLPNGENMVLRVLPRESPLMGMQQLGFFEKDIKKVHQMFNEPFGIVLLTGPTGSGKSTTLYAGIRTLNLLERNVVTVEDPVEYRIPLLRQTQVNEKAGYTFSGAIRHFLRHDPDVIMVGEIRDSETAGTAISASATGHLVLSTLHTNDAFGAMPRLVDLGVKPFLIADSLIGVASQRLVRKICRNCKEPYKPEAWEKTYLNDPSAEELYRGKGCDLCNGTGYFGRTLVYELLTIDDELSRLISIQAEPVAIVEKAKENGFNDMRSVAIEKVKEGITTTEEAARVLGQIKTASDMSDETPVAYGAVRAL
jgi:type II secretory ATPase GspE/PulE/Tfp pilus assembly ATPase PilB-like protein